jgi:hypothetical protein
MAAHRRPAAAFDTRLPAMLTGGVAPGIARGLRHHGFGVIAEPEDFRIQENGEGPLKDGETECARSWAADLVRQVAVPVPHQTCGPSGQDLRLSSRISAARGLAP